MLRFLLTGCSGRRAVEANETERAAWLVAGLFMRGGARRKLRRKRRTLRVPRECSNVVQDDSLAAFQVLLASSRRQPRLHIHRPHPVRGCSSSLLLERALVPASRQVCRRQCRIDFARRLSGSRILSDPRGRKERSLTRLRDKRGRPVRRCAGRPELTFLYGRPEEWQRWGG